MIRRRVFSETLPFPESTRETVPTPTDAFRAISFIVVTRDPVDNVPWLILCLTCNNLLPQERAFCSPALTAFFSWCRIFLEALPPEERPTMKQKLYRFVETLPSPENSK